MPRRKSGCFLFSLFVLFLTCSAALAGDGIVWGPISPDPRAPGYFGQQAEQEFWTEDRLRKARPMDVIRLDGQPDLIGPMSEGLSLSAPGKGPKARPLIEPSSIGRGLLPMVLVEPGVPGEEGRDPFPPWDCPASEYDQDFPDTHLDWWERAIGKLFFVNPEGAEGECSATVVNESLVVTAGHCVSTNGVWHTDFLFLPGYFHGQQPFGRWYVRQPVTFKSWTESSNISRDVAFLQMYPNGLAKIGRTVGYAGFSAEIEVEGMTWHQYGYPAESPFDGNRLARVISGFGHKDFHGDNPFTVGVGSNFTGGSSGGPWVFSDGIGGIIVNGLNSYIYQVCEETMYSPYFDREIWDFYQMLKRQQ